MAEDNATVKKAGASETSQVTDAETVTSPKGGGGEAPETVDSDAVVDTASEDDKKDELQEQARERGLDDSGTKKELAARINEHDEQGAHKPEVLFPVAKD